MNSYNDTTILAMLSRYPEMDNEEADKFIAKIEHEENVPICYAVLGRISPDELESDARQTFNEFKDWAERRTQRTREEQWTARRRQQETDLSRRMNQLHQQGIINDQTMLMYGISGDLPERSMYFSLSPEQKQAIWEEKMSNRFGPNWRNVVSRNVTRLLVFHKEKPLQSSKVNWAKEGF